MHFKQLKSVGELSKVCSQIVLKCFFLARIGRPDILWSRKKLARSITKWTKACDKRLNRLIFQIFIIRVNTNSVVMWVILLSKADWDCFKTLTSREILKIQKATSGGTFCVFGNHTNVPISWMCEKQTSVSHSSTESEIISLDAGLRLDGKPALDLWDFIVAILHGNAYLFAVHERFWFCFVQVSTTQFCFSHLFSWHVRMMERMCQFLHYLPPLRKWVLLTALFLTSKEQDTVLVRWRRKSTKRSYSCEVAATQTERIHGRKLRPNAFPDRPRMMRK